MIGRDDLDVAIANHLQLEKEEKIELNEELKETVAALHSLPVISDKFVVSSIQLLNTYRKLLPSVVQALALELKPLPTNLKYAYLGENETLPVIISNQLSKVQEEKLL